MSEPNLRTAMEREAERHYPSCIYSPTTTIYCREGFTFGAQWMAREAIRLAKEQADDYETDGPFPTSGAKALYRFAVLLVAALEQGEGETTAEPPVPPSGPSR